MFLVLQIPAFHVPGFTDSGFSCSWFYRFRLFMFLVLQIPAFHVPVFLVPRSVPRSVPRFPVPCFTDSPMFIAQNSATRFEKKHALLKCCNFDGKRQTRNCSLTFAVPRKNAMLKVSNITTSTRAHIVLILRYIESGIIICSKKLYTV